MTPSLSYFAPQLLCASAAPWFRDQLLCSSILGYFVVPCPATPWLRASAAAAAASAAVALSLAGGGAAAAGKDNKSPGEPVRASKPKRQTAGVSSVGYTGHCLDFSYTRYAGK